MPTRRIPRGRWLPSLVGGAIVLLLVSCCVRESLPPDSEAEEGTSNDSTVVVDYETKMPNPDAPPITLIAPGTVIEARAPEDWTHLIVKSHPRAAVGDVDKLPERVQQLSGKFFTALVARVKSEKEGGQAHSVLDDVGLGMGTRIGSQDTIITTDTQNALGADLGLLERMALEKGYNRFKGVRVAARTKTMAVIDGPAMMLIGNKHQPVVLRYAVLVDPQSGQLETLLWVIVVEESGAYAGMYGVCEWLPPDILEKRILHVDSNEFSFGMVTENALALVQLYKGREQFTFADDVKHNAESARLSPESAAAFERQLWALIRHAPAEAH